MSTNTTMASTTNASRAADAKLHELLFRVTCEMRYCQLNDADEWYEQQSAIEEGIRGEETYWRERLPKYRQHPDFMHPCYWDSEFKRWWVVPRYHEDLNALRAAELALAPELREDYARELINELVDREDLTGIFAYEGRDRYEEALAYKGIYALITATAAQRAQALVAVLERVRGEVGT